ncbi:MAG: septation protein SpoVG family protein, partial [Eubacteriales bacterium]
NLEVDMPAFRTVVTPFERGASNIRGLGRIYLEDVFVINNVSVLQGKESMFVAMPSYKTNQKDQQGKDIYQDICYPVTKEFRSVLHGEVVNAYEVAKEKQEDVVGDGERKNDRDGFQEVEERELPFR